MRRLVRGRESNNIRAARNDKFSMVLKRTRRSSSFVAVVRFSKQEEMRLAALFGVHS